MVKQYFAVLLKEVVVEGEHYTMVGKTEGMLAVLAENKNVRAEASLQFARIVVNGSPITTHMRTYVIQLEIGPNYFRSSELAFELLDIQCWIDELIVNSRYGNITQLARDLDVSAMMLYRALKAD